MLRFFRAAGVLLSLCVGLSASAQEDTTADISTDQIAATIGTIQITEQELEEAFRSRGARFGPNDTAARDQTRDLVVAEYWVDVNYARLAQRDPTVKPALDEARRQVLFEVYSQSLFDPVPPTEAEIAAFIEANPDLFEDRRVFRMVQFSVAAEGAQALSRVEQHLTALGTLPSDARSGAFADALEADGTPFVQFRFWEESERFPSEILDRLKALQLTGRYYDTRPTEVGLDVIVLIDAEAAPADPANLRDEISNRILQARYQEHRVALAQEIAAPLLGFRPLEEAVGRRALSQDDMILNGALGAAIGFAIGSFLRWIGRARQYQAQARRGSIDEMEISFFRQPFGVSLMAVFGILIALVAGALVILWQILAGGPIEGAAIFAGGLVVVALIAALMGSGKPDSDQAAKRQMARMELRIALSLLLIAGSVGYGYVVAREYVDPTFEFRLLGS